MEAKVVFFEECISIGVSGGGLSTKKQVNDSEKNSRKDLISERMDSWNIRA